MTRRLAAAILVLALLGAGPAGALTREEFLQNLKELQRHESVLRTEGKAEEASQALKERLGYLSGAAQNTAAGPSPGSHADLIQTIRLAAAVSVKLANAQEEGASLSGASELRSALSKAAKGWIEEVEIGELKRYPREGSWGGYFVGKLKNFRAVVEAGYEADLLADEDKRRLNELVLPVNEDFFQQKFRKEIEKIKASPFQEASYKNIRAYLSALDELGREIPEMAALSPAFLKARSDEFLGLLESLAAPLEKEVLRSEGNAYLQDGRSHEEFKQSADYQKETAAAGAYQRWERGAEDAKGDPVAAKIAGLFLLQAKKPYLDLYAKWYEANRMGVKRKEGEGSEKGGDGTRQESRLGNIRVRGAELMDDPKTSGMMEKLRDDSGRKEEGRKEAKAWVESAVADIQRKAASGDENALQDSKKVLDFAQAYLREELPRVEEGLRKADQGLFEQARANQDVPAMLAAAERLESLGGTEKALREQTKVKKEVRSAILAKYESAVAAGDLEGMAKLASYAESGRLPKEEFPVKAEGERYRKDVADIVGRRYEEARKAESLAEMYKFVEMGRGKGDSWPVTGARFAQDALDFNAKKLENALRLRNPVLVQAAYDRAKDESLAAHPEASRQRKEALRFLERKDMAPPDTLDSEASRNEAAAADAAREEAPPEDTQELARYESVPEHPISGSPRGYPKIKNLPVKPPSHALQGRKAVGFEETVNLRLNDHWGKVDTELKWVHSQSVSASGSLKYDVVRVWYLAEKGPETRTADDKSLAAAKYEKLNLGGYPQAFAWESARAQLTQYTLTAGAEGMEAANGAIQQVHNARMKAEAWKKGVEELRKFLVSKDDAVSRLVEEQLLPLTRSGIIVTLEVYDNAVRAAVDGFLKTKPKGMPDFLALAGFDIRRMADEELARRAENRRKAPKELPPEDDCERAKWNLRKSIPLNVSEGEVDSLRREMNQALDGAAKSEDLKGFADKLESQVQKWESLYRRALKSYYGPLSVQCSYSRGRDTLRVAHDLKEPTGTALARDGKPAEKGWAAGDPNEPMARHLINALNAVMAKQEAVLAPVVMRVEEAKRTAAREVFEMAEPLAEGRRAAHRLRTTREVAGAKEAEKGGLDRKEEAPKSENGEERIAELQSRASALEFEAKEAEKGVEVIREVRPKLALAAKADAARKENLAKAQDLDKSLDGLDRILKADQKPRKVTEETWKPWGLDASTAYDVSMAKMSENISQTGIEQSVLAAHGGPAPPPGEEPPSVEDIPFQELAEETDKKADILFQMVVEAPKLKERLQDRLAWERHFQTYAAEYRDAIREARWQNKLARQVRPKEKVLEDPRIRERIGMPEYAQARREMDNLEQEYASARKETQANQQFIAREEKRKEGCSVPSLQDTVVRQFKSYENGDASEFMRHVSSRFRGLDRFGLGLGRAGLEKSISDDLRNLQGIQFDVAVDPPQSGSRQDRFRLPLTWAIRARLGATGEEWIAKTQRSTLHYDCDLDADPPGFLLASIEGENIFGRSNYAGVTVVDKGTVDGQTLAAPQAVVNGNTTADPSLMVGFSGVAGTPNSTVGGSASFTEVLPNAAFVGSQTQLKIFGTGFTAGPSLAVEFAQGAVNACAFQVSNLAVLSDKELSLTLTLDPDALGVSGTAQSGTIGVKLTNGNGATATLNPAFLVSAPKIASVSPAALSFSSSAQVTITGSDLRSSLTYGFLSTDPTTTVTGVTRVNDTTLTAVLDGMSASGSFSLYLSATGASTVCSPVNIQGGVTLLEAGRADYEVNP